MDTTQPVVRPNLISGRTFVQALLKAGVPIGENIQKVVIEATYDGGVRLYVQHLGDERLLAVDWSSVSFEIHGQSVGSNAAGGAPAISNHQ